MKVMIVNHPYRDHAISDIVELEDEEARSLMGFQRVIRVDDDKEKTVKKKVVKKKTLLKKLFRKGKGK